MPIATKCVSEELSLEIAKAWGFRDHVLEAVPQRFLLDTDQKTLIVALFSLAAEHHGAILHLLRATCFDGSAFALARPMLEATIRAHWLTTRKSRTLVAKIVGGQDKYPFLKDMIADIDTGMTIGHLYKQLEPALKTFHGYTHGGIEQLARRFDAAGNVCSTYTDEAKIDLVRSMTAFMALTAVTWSQVCSDTPGIESDHSRAITAEYGRLFEQRAKTASAL